MVENLLFWDAGEMTFYNFCMCMSTEIQEQHAVIDKVGLPVMLGLNLLEYTCYALIFCEMRRYVKGEEIIRDPEMDKSAVWAGSGCMAVFPISGSSLISSPGTGRPWWSETLVGLT